MSYVEGEVQINGYPDENTEAVGDSRPGIVFLPHRCDNWIIGGRQQVLDMIHDLYEALEILEKRETSG